jgi:hypothetical protein
MEMQTMAETNHTENMRRILEHALALAEQIGREQDAVRREELIVECLACWQIAQRLRRWPNQMSRA